jgi:hypothetical protein
MTFRSASRSAYRGSDIINARRCIQIKDEERVGSLMNAMRALVEGPSILLTIARFGGHRSSPRTIDEIREILKIHTWHSRIVLRSAYLRVLLVRTKRLPPIQSVSFEASPPHRNFPARRPSTDRRNLSTPRLRSIKLKTYPDSDEVGTSAGLLAGKGTSHYATYRSDNTR